MTYLSTIHTTFPGPALPAGWSLASTSGSPTESFSAGALRVTGTSGTSFNYYRLGPVDLTDSATNWFRFRHDGTASAFWELTTDDNASGTGQIYAYANGGSLYLNGQATITYDPVAHAFIGLKWVDSTHLEVYAAPSNSGLPGTPTLLVTVPYGTYSIHPEATYIVIALGSLGSAPAWGEIVAVNPVTAVASLTLGSTSGSRSVTAGATAFSSSITTPITYTGSGALAATPSDSTLAASIASGVLTITAGAGLSALAAGTYTPTVTVSDGTLTATYTVTLTVNAAVSQGPSTFQWIVTPKDAGGATVAGVFPTFVSSAPTVASVNNTGLVQGLSVGTATVTAYCGGQSTTLAVTVTANGQSGSPSYPSVFSSTFSNSFA